MNRCRVEPGVTMFDGRDDDALSLALALPATVCVDSGCADGADPPYHASLLLRLSTAAATRLDVANAFCAALKNRAPQLAGHLSDIRYAVHEAIANAVMHGNLGLDSGLRSDMAGLARFAEAMEQRLADPVHARLPVIIAARTLGDRVLISVEDQGMGFWPQDIRPPASAASGGMGLAIIAKCCRRVRFSKGGRRITMMFGGR